MAITYINVTGTYRAPSGNPCSGEVIFTPAAFFVDDTENIIYPNKPIVVKLSTDGFLDAYIPTSDDPDVDPTTMFYKIEEHLYEINTGYRAFRTYSVFFGAEYLPAVDLMHFMPSHPETAEDPAEATIVLLSGEQGDTGPTGATGATGPQGNNRVHGRPLLVEKITNGYHIPGRYAIGAPASTGTGILRMSSFILPASLTANFIRYCSSNNTVPTGISLCRMGIYEKDAVGSGWTLIASIANDPTIGAIGSVVYKRAVTSPVTLQANKLYGVAILMVQSGANFPIYAFSNGSLFTTGSALPGAEKSAYFLASQTDLPSTMTPTESSTQPWMSILSA